MKNLLMMSALLTAMSLTSCVKTRNCECVEYENGKEVGKNTFTVKGTKSQTKTACELLNTNDGTDETKCTLK